MTADPETPSPAPRRLSRRRRILYLCLPFAVFCAFFATIELATRRVTYPYSLLEAYTGPAFPDFDAENLKGVVFEGDPVLMWRMIPNLEGAYWNYTTFSTNAQGFRHDREIGEKAPGALRIVCVGDSVTFGYRVPRTLRDSPDHYDRSHKPYPALLEEHLREADPDREIEVISLGVSGYSSLQNLIMLERHIDWLRPDLVTICTGWNDTRLRGREDKHTITTNPMRIALRWIGARSQALTLGAHWIRLTRQEQSGGPTTPSVPRVSAEDYVSNCLAMVELARAQGSRVIAIGPVLRDTNSYTRRAMRLVALRESLARSMADAEVPYLEIEELTERSHPENVRLFDEQLHPNHAGHALMAERLFEFINHRR